MSNEKSVRQGIQKYDDANVRYYSVAFKTVIQTCKQGGVGSRGIFRFSVSYSSELSQELIIYPENCEEVSILNNYKDIQTIYLKPTKQNQNELQR
jgi:hypothetical protein